MLVSSAQCLRRHPIIAQAASEAYDATLAPVHTYFVRTAVKASLYLLPDRATFLHSIGETGQRPLLIGSNVSCTAALAPLKHSLLWPAAEPCSSLVLIMLRGMCQVRTDRCASSGCAPCVTKSQSPIVARRGDGKGACSRLCAQGRHICGEGDAPVRRDQHACVRCPLPAVSILERPTPRSECAGGGGAALLTGQH